MNAVTDLEAWKTGIALVEKIHKLTSKFPKSEQFTMVSQMRRASQSILANLAEGFSRTTNADKANKYVIARGECSETKAFLCIAKSVNYGTAEEIDTLLELCEKTGKLLSGLIKRFQLP